jgi:hypothetical protein
MKTIALCLVIIFAFIASCKKDDKIKEVPDEIIRVKMDSVLFDRITQLFPNGQNSLGSLPSLFTDTVQKQILVTRESEVYVTFIAEGATYKNTLGWYSYLAGHAPANVGEIQKNIVFPNISAAGEGGLLNPGDMVQLGTSKFTAGTIIGLFLISNGWKDGSIDYNAPTYYTDYKFNPGAKQQHVLFREKKGKSIVLGFEDRDFDAVTTDKDYNDILLNISDNKDGYENISFDMEKIPLY